MVLDREVLDRDLLLLVGKGNRAAWGELYKRNAWRIAAFFRKKGEAEDVVEDLTADVFLRLRERGRQYRGGDPHSYMFAFAANIWRDFLRRGKKREEHEVRLDFEWVEVWLEAAGKRWKALEAPDRTADVDFRIDFEWAIGKLSEKERVAFTLSEAGYTFRQIARIMGCCAATASHKKKRAIWRLQRLLADYNANGHPVVPVAKLRKLLAGHDPNK